MDLADHLDRAGGAAVFLSVVTASELLQGIYRSTDPRHRAKRMAFVERVLGLIPALPIDMSIARVHAEMASAVSSTGTPVGPHDLWLAATAVAGGLILVTTNARELGRVPGLAIEDWTTGALPRTE